ncbi:MAG: hypothetical protein VX527_11535 [Planctomycetota bacterium]|nr:hypothetical protein [Planctomycetota bacterium]
MTRKLPCYLAICLVCVLYMACLGCESTKQYGVGVRGDIPVFQEPESLIKSYNRSLSLGQVPPYKAAGQEYFFVRLVPDMTAYYTAMDAPSWSDLNVFTEGCDAQFDLLVAMRQLWSRQSVARALESWACFNATADDQIDLSTLRILDDQNATAYGQVTCPVSAFSHEMKQYELTYILVKTDEGWKIVFHDLRNDGVGSLMVYITETTLSCVKAVADQVNQGDYGSIEDVKRAFEDRCIRDSDTSAMDAWIRARKDESPQGQ